MDIQKKRIDTSLVEIKALADGVVEGIVATDSVDRHGEKISIQGLDIKTYMATSGAVLFGHDYWALPIGKTLSLRKSAGKLIAKFQLATEINDFAKQVYDMITGDYLKGLSIGFIPTEWDEKTNTWTKAEMIEFSVVPVPANSDAMITSKSVSDKYPLVSSFMKSHAKEISGQAITSGFATTAGTLPNSYQITTSGTSLAKEQTNDDNKIKEQMDSLTKQVSALEKEIHSLDTDTLQEQSSSERRKLVLVTAKKNAQIVDKQVELIISGLKKSLQTNKE
ncbi:HK97 family phage prohead protease [Polynucleobacter sp.]|uniref:HK97 family phage prohead protease n=1 Tax=Polynucleobacter sp. TaxID=2029855 RepID=UPI003F6A4ACC